MFPSALRLLRPVFRNGKAGTTLLRNSTKQSCLFSTARILRADKEEGNPFSIDDMILNSSKEDLENFKVPDPVREHQENQHKPNLNEDEIILNMSANNSESLDSFNVDGHEEDEYMNDDDISSEILNVALEFVPTYGWSQRSIDAAVEALELSISTAGMFKRGSGDLVLHFIETSNAKLYEYLASESKRFATDESVNTSAFIEKAIQERLKMIIPFIDSWPQALSLIASPSMASEVLEQGANMIDEIWYHAGDMSSDMSWYSKRAAVAALHVSSELFMLQDKSPHFEDTWDFLHRRMKDLEAASTICASIDHAVEDAMNLAGAGFTTAQNILGINNRNR